MGEVTATSSEVRLTHFARRPAVGAAVALILGILVHRVLPDVPKAWLALAAAGAIAAVACRRWGHVANVLLALAVGLVGVAVGQIERYRFAPDHVGQYTSDAARLAEIEVVIDQPPRESNAASPGGRPLPARQVTRATVRRVRAWDGWREAVGEVNLHVSPPQPGLAFGQRVTVLGMLSRPPVADNPGQFDWASYYRAQRVLAAIDAEPQNVRVVAAGGFSLLQWLRDGARSLLAAGFTKEQALDHSLLRALLLGDYDPELRDVQEDFRRTGTSHHLSISGMHVAVLGAVVYFLCRLVRLSPRKSAIAMMAFVVLYGLVALPAPPVIRSIVLCLCFGVGVLMRRTVDGVQLLAVTVVIMLLIDPLDLYNPGFQLSFLTVLGLMLYATKLQQFLDRQDEDQRVLMSLGIPPTRAQSIRNWGKRHLLGALAAGLVAWSVSAPLIVQHFDQLNPWAVPAGMVLALPVFLSMIGGLFKVVLTLCVPWLAPLWAWLAAAPVELMRGTVAGLAKIPGSDVPLPAVPVLIVLLYYLALTLPLVPTGRRRVKWAFRGGAATACATALLLPLLIGFAPRGGGGAGELTVTLLSVGAGQCAVVRTPSGKTILIDAGSSTLTDLERRCLAPFLRQAGVSRIDSVFVSHANVDHFSAVARAAGEYRVREVLVTGAFRRHGAKNPSAAMMLRRLDELKCPAREITAGERVWLDDECDVEVLWPAADATRMDANDTSQVLRLTCRGRSILFTGDIQAPAEGVLLATEAQRLAADVLIAPHHGSAEPTTGRFLEAVGPTAILLASNDRTLSGKQRAFDRLVEGRTFYRTDRYGAVTVRIAKDGSLSVTTFRHP